MSVHRFTLSGTPAEFAALFSLAADGGVDVLDSRAISRWILNECGVAPLAKTTLCPWYSCHEWENIIGMVERQHICKCDGPCPQHVDCPKRQQILQEEQQ